RAPDVPGEQGPARTPERTPRARAGAGMREEIDPQMAQMKKSKTADEDTRRPEATKAAGTHRTDRDLDAQAQRLMPFADHPPRRPWERLRSFDVHFLLLFHLRHLRNLRISAARLL